MIRRFGGPNFWGPCSVHGGGARRVAGSPVRRRHVGNASEFAVRLGWTEPHGTSRMLLFFQTCRFDFHILAYVDG